MSQLPPEEEREKISNSSSTQIPYIWRPKNVQNRPKNVQNRPKNVLCQMAKM
jgi:hypothetical protein